LQHGGQYQVGQESIGDFNGDGKDDLIYHSTDNTFWVSITNASGTGFDSPQLWLQHGGQYQVGQESIGDFNGDGKDDLIYHSTDNSLWVSITNSSGNMFNGSAQWLISPF
jgi:hypothetical protein